MTADPSPIAVAPGEKSGHQAGQCNSPRKDAPNPQQGMADPAASVGAATAPTVSNTACTSPLTVTSLEAAAAAGALAAKDSNEQAVPVVVNQVMPVKPTPTKAPPGELPVEALANLGLGPGIAAGPGAARPNQVLGQNLAAPRAANPPASEPDRRHHHARGVHHGAKHHHRTPPTEHDDRKLFVGGLPTDVTDEEFLDYFSKFGEVIDSVVMTDRVTRRSRGFGFVTFASEQDALALLTAVPGKTGYVLLGGKQCEVKASTPKSDDGPPKHHHHGAPGMWRSNPPHHNHPGGYHPGQTMKPGQAKQHGMRPKARHFDMGSEFNGDVDGRNFDEVYAGQQYFGYQQAGYGRSGQPAAYTNQGYQSYQYPSGYVYASGPGGESVPNSNESSYPAAASTGQYNPYDPYAAQQFPGQYGQYGDNGAAPAAMGTMGYANYPTGYYAEDGASVPSQGLDASEGSGMAAYPQAYQGGGYPGQYE